MALPLFGGTLENGIKRSKFALPEVVVHCAQFIRKQGAFRQGLLTGD